MEGEEPVPMSTKEEDQLPPVSTKEEGEQLPPASTKEGDQPPVGSTEEEEPPPLEEIVKQMRELLKGADLNQLTFRQVMTSLEEHFKVSLVALKKDLRKQLDAIIDEQNDEDDRSGEVTKTEVKSEGTVKVKKEQQKKKAASSASKGANSVAKRVKTEGSTSSGAKGKRGESSEEESADEKGEDEDDDSDDSGGKKSESEEEYQRGDDDNEEGSKKGSKKKKGSRKITGESGFQKPQVLSEALAEFVGAPMMSRPQVVKKIWEYIRQNNLQNPKNRTEIICDEKLSSIMEGQPRVTAFNLNKYLSSHYPESVAKKKLLAEAKAARGEDGSADEDSKGEKSKKRKKSGGGGGGGLTKPKRLSASMSEFIGEPMISRTQLVKKLAEYIKANNLQDPKDKRKILPDEKMTAAFVGKLPKKLNFFNMNKYIGAHLLDDE
mmetsp:Transcript_45635/g.74400  ORF Transcript_45635/g.74400 Transcript_45635/m.74400 type:complete len:435 (+) Transcript_45635:120-1424(+)|eukprot:CAMPEP_0184648242 /NCGR_PEP_ID=MMETSP0308-20130426/5315_1 /TAXON_ID=38269 /ORGANISM="Gloeochaete witrockiana, Strain SAG 46.84" /LENGTH=434 /DNA_ID=CAMNT_0027079905 /DNA_START=67 /DNA_END=1371 /DNA_ORIENTATION=+